MSAILAGANALTLAYLLSIDILLFSFLGFCFFNRCLDQAHLRVRDYEDPFIDRTTDVQILN